MKNFLTKSLSKLLLSKVFLLLVLFFGGCEVALVPSAYLQYLLGDRQGVVTVDDISIIDDGKPTMRFTINNSKATSVTVYTLDSTNTLAFTEGAYSSSSNGAYTYAVYESSNIKLWLANFDLKSGIYKLYSNGVVIDEGNFGWYIGDIILEPEPEPTFLDYFKNGQTYGDENYEFVYADSTLGGYSFDEDSCTVDGMLVGTFGYNDLEDGQWGTYLIATVNTTDGTITIETITTTNPTVPSAALVALIGGGSFWSVSKTRAMVFSSDATILTSIHFSSTPLPYISGGDNCAVYEGTVSNKGVVKFVLENIGYVGTTTTIRGMMTIYENEVVSMSTTYFYPE